MSKATLTNISPLIPNQVLQAGLYVVPTPIGNLLDITLRAVFVLQKADVIYCEDKRVTSKLLQQFGIKNDLQLYNDHSQETARTRILENIKSGKIVALVSDAGTPMISDPGFKLAQNVIDAGFLVTSLPGANAILPALCNSGLPNDSFSFTGFLPNKNKLLEDKIKSLPENMTYIAYESPKRVLKTLQVFNKLFSECKISISKEISKLHEATYRGTAAEILDKLSKMDTIKGEFVICFHKPKQKTTFSATEIENYAKNVLTEKSASKAAKDLAERFDISKDEAYKLILKLKN